ncbi:YecR family lipoprotein [Cronobacter turicensis]|uniref:YecR family lipoprotein n=1 Tax=Cronobacter turicensis TaxID=413502 RepID=A0ACD5IV72_9ENTR|nr:MULTISPECIES: YecR family lipoprotein [Cronobacter]MEB8537584.1 YecR family lipoprotein [Cronobacter sakazakii]EKM0435988.1 YecR-like lipofamily protein [Cronobacter turicensis]EKM0527387.1 YecR-like lipofamily protein [Cronobacter turicensis]EKM0530821.1 YecR-like lipofamily protein [Cronobacter turicensis]EKY1942094.1 YecR-like lipofamily protein [Cronobacter turicensis]
MRTPMRKVIIITALLALSGCTITKTPEIVGGSKVTGTVRLGISEQPLQHAKVDNYVAQSMANRQCQDWGYAVAEAYGAPVKTCSVVTGTQCMTESIVLEYQCRGFTINNRAVSGW